MASNRHSPRLGRMLQLAMTAVNFDHLPSVFTELSEDVPELHSVMV